MKNIPGIDLEVYEDQYEWENGGYLDDVEEGWEDEWEEDEGFDDDFPLSLEYDEGEDDMYADGEGFYTNEPW